MTHRLQLHRERIAAALLCGPACWLIAHSGLIASVVSEAANIDKKTKGIGPLLRVVDETQTLLLVGGLAVMTLAGIAGAVMIAMGSLRGGKIVPGVILGGALAASFPGIMG